MGFALAVVLSAAAAGCGGDSEPTVAQPAPQTPAVSDAQEPADPNPAAADKRNEAGKAFFLSLDDDAIALEEQITAMQDSDQATAAKGRQGVARVKATMVRKTRAGERQMARESKGAAALIAAADQALKAATPRELVEARVAAQKARTEFTGEFIGPNAIEP